MIATLSMKILMIGPFPEPIDGCSLANSIFYQNVKKRNLQVQKIDTNTDIVSSKQGDTFSVQKAVSFLSKYLYCYKILSADIIYFTPGQTFFGVMKYSPFLWLCQMFQKPYIIHVHGNYLGNEYQRLIGFKKKLFKQLLSKAAAGIILSRSLKNNFYNLLPESKIFIVENFASNDIYSVQKKKKTDKLRILYLSNLIAEKGILYLLKALVILNQTNIDFYAVLAGIIDAKIEAEVNELLKELKGKVVYKGVLGGDNKLRELWNANVFVLPTFYPMEGQPISLLEGIATGNVIITTKHAGIPDIVNETNGFFVEKQSADSLASCLQNVSNNLPSYVNRFSKQNSNYAASHFTEKKFTERILMVLTSALKTK